MGTVNTSPGLQPASHGDRFEQTRVRTSGDGQYDVQSQKIREQTYYGEPAADGHYTVSRAAEQ